MPYCSIDQRGREAATHQEREELLRIGRCLRRPLACDPSMRCRGDQLLFGVFGIDLADGLIDGGCRDLLLSQVAPQSDRTDRAPFQPGGRESLGILLVVEVVERLQPTDDLLNDLWHCPLFLQEPAAHLDNGSWSIREQAKGPLQGLVVDLLGCFLGHLLSHLFVLTSRMIF